MGWLPAHYNTQLVTMASKQFGVLTWVVISYGLPYAIGEESELIPEVPDICGELRQRFKEVSFAIKDNKCDADPSKEEEWRMHEDCYELGMDIPRCMKGANNLAEVEKCCLRLTRVLNLLYTAVSAWD